MHHPGERALNVRRYQTRARVPASNKLGGGSGDKDILDKRHLLPADRAQRLRLLHQAARAVSVQGMEAGEHPSSQPAGSGTPSSRSRLLDSWWTASACCPRCPPAPRQPAQRHVAAANEHRLPRRLPTDNTGVHTALCSICSRAWLAFRQWQSGLCGHGCLRPRSAANGKRSGQHRSRSFVQAGQQTAALGNRWLRTQRRTALPCR